MIESEPKQDLTHQLVGRFKVLIGQGVLQPGARLPPERELAERFAVSRSSLRHALKVLDIMGVIRQRVGDGTYVTDSASLILSEPLEFLFLLDGISLLDLIETRLIVEPELAARAAQYATSEHLAALRVSLQAMEKVRDQEKAIEADLEFHQAIFRAAGNLLCDRLFSLIHRSMGKSMIVTSRMVDSKHTLAFHRPIYAAIDKRKPDEARKRMAEHLTDARKLLLQAGSPAIPFQQFERIQPLTEPRRQKSRQRPQSQGVLESEKK